MPKMCQRYAKNTQKMFQRYTKDTPNICQKFSKDIPKKHQIYAKTMPKKWQKNCDKPLFSGGALFNNNFFIHNIYLLIIPRFLFPYRRMEGIGCQNLLCHVMSYVKFYKLYISCFLQIKFVFTNNFLLSDLVYQDILR